MKLTYPKNVHPGAKPVYIKRGDVGIFLIHGTTSSPYSLKFLAEYLAKRGFSVYVPLVPGHGTKISDLLKTNEKIWYSGIEEEFLKFRKDVKKIFVGGLCTGGNLALELAAKYPVDGVISLGTFINLRFKFVLVPMIVLTHYFKKTVHKEQKLTPEDKQYYYLGGAYPRFPLETVLQILSLVNKTKKLLHNVSAPTLVIHSTKDYIVSLSSAYFILNNIKTSKNNKELIKINKSNHLPIDVTKPWLSEIEVFDKVYRFIKKYS